MNQQEFDNYVTMIKKNEVETPILMLDNEFILMNEVERAKLKWDNKFITMRTSDLDKRTVLHVAAINNVPELVPFFIENGLEVDVGDKFGYSALQDAAYYGHYNVVTLLIENDANINLLNKFKFTALHYAAAKGHHDIVALLIEKGANINLLNIDRESPLHRAAAEGHHNTVTLLIEKGADINLLNKNSDTPLKLAEDHNHLECVSILKEQSDIMELDSVVAVKTNLHSLESTYAQGFQVQVKWVTDSICFDGKVTADTSSDKQRKFEICFICDVKCIDCSLECGHIFCTECVKQLDRCPTCREQIRSARELFF